MKLTDQERPDKQKPGPDPETLIIEEDPEEALSRLIKKPPRDQQDEGSTENEDPNQND